LNFQFVFYDQAASAAIHFSDISFIHYRDMKYKFSITWIPHNSIFLDLVINDEKVYYHNLLHNHLHRSVSAHYTTQRMMKNTRFTFYVIRSILRSCSVIYCILVMVILCLDNIQNFRFHPLNYIIHNIRIKLVVKQDQ
jgi:hypothetical protein